MYVGEMVAQVKEMFAHFDFVGDFRNLVGIIQTVRHILAPQIPAEEEVFHENSIPKYFEVSDDDKKFICEMNKVSDDFYRSLFGLPTKCDELLGHRL
jgi:hypothetical protein